MPVLSKNPSIASRCYSREQVRDQCGNYVTQAMVGAASAVSPDGTVPASMAERTIQSVSNLINTKLRRRPSFTRMANPRPGETNETPNQPLNAVSCDSRHGNRLCPDTAQPAT